MFAVFSCEKAERSVRYIVYDTETSGLDTTFDQIFQFAAVLADQDLNEVDSFVVRCRRLPHIVPSPEALLVTGVRPVDLEQAELSFHQMMLNAHRKLVEWSKGGAVFLGYNSIQFDERLLRQALYQNLLPVYLTNTNGNVRGDVMRMVQACAVHHPNKMTIPADEARSAVFKLGEVTAANGIALDHAHDALADARATLAVARLLRERIPDGWTWMLRMASKKGVQAALRSPVLCLTNWHFGTPYSFMVTPAGSITGASSEVAMFDLAYDPAPYLDLPHQTLRDYITGQTKVIRRLRTNAQPMLFPADLAPDDLRGGKLSAALYLDRSRRMQMHPRFRAMLTQVMSHLYDDEPPAEHVEQRIYDGFPPDADLVMLRDFHNAAWAERPSIARRFSDKRLRALARRLICVERPGLLSAAERHRFDDFVASRLLADGDVPWMTVRKALDKVEQLSQSAGSEQRDRLVEIGTYLRDIARQPIYR
jgi:exodeoxyribonuclease I